MIENLRNRHNSLGWPVLSSVVAHAALLVVFLWSNEPLTIGTQASSTLSAKLVMVSGETADKASVQMQPIATSARVKATSEIVSPLKATKVIAVTTQAQKTQAITKRVVKHKKPDLEKPAKSKIAKIVPPTSVVAKPIKKLDLKPEVVTESQVVVSKEMIEAPKVETIAALPKNSAVKTLEPTPTPVDKVELAEPPTSKEPQLSAVAAASGVDNAEDSTAGVSDTSGESITDAVGSADTDQPIAFVEANIRVKKMTPPKYPHYAILQRKSGTAIVAIELNEKGGVKTSTLHESSAHKILDKAVLHAARKWRFYPPVPVGEVLVPVRFELECSSNACTPKQVQQG